MKGYYVLAYGLVLGFDGVAAHAQKDLMVGGAEMYPTKNIVENAMNSKDPTTLVAAMKAAGLVQTPSTVFAPTKAVFDKLPWCRASTHNYQL